MFPQGLLARVRRIDPRPGPRARNAPPGDRRLELLRRFFGARGGQGTGLGPSRPGIGPGSRAGLRRSGGALRGVLQPFVDDPPRTGAAPAAQGAGGGPAGQAGRPGEGPQCPAVDRKICPGQGPSFGPESGLLLWLPAGAPGFGVGLRPDGRPPNDGPDDAGGRRDTHRLGFQDRVLRRRDDHSRY